MLFKSFRGNLVFNSSLTKSPRKQSTISLCICNVTFFLLFFLWLYRISVMHSVRGIGRLFTIWSLKNTFIKHFQLGPQSDVPSYSANTMFPHHRKKNGAVIMVWAAALQLHITPKDHIWVWLRPQFRNHHRTAFCMSFQLYYFVSFVALKCESWNICILLEKIHSCLYK